jgi:hypothetical protein
MAGLKMSMVGAHLDALVGVWPIQDSSLLTVDR